MRYAYSPHTGEIIKTEVIVDWMGVTEIAPPAYDEQIESCFFNNGAWEIVPMQPDPEAIPDSVTRRQGRLALLEIGKLSDVENAIASIVDPAERMAAEIEYDADTWERSNLFLQAIWQQLGGTEQELDDLFILASKK